MLLAIGLSQVGLVASAFFVGWLVALGWRKEHAVDGVVVFNLRQVVVVTWTLAALGILAVAMYEGLLGAPEMQVRGNGSTSSLLVWTSDRVAPALPTAWMASVPILVYRAAMLAWALWAAIALLRWLKWGWSAFTEGGGWKKSPPPPPRPPQAPPNVAQGYPPQGWQHPPPGYGPPPPPQSPPAT
jgi:hypothetical protein